MKKINILNLNHLGGKTGSARLMETIMSGLSSNQFSSHALVGYAFGSPQNTTSLYRTRPDWLYRNIRYKGAVGLNFFFDIMTPGCIDMQYLHTFSPYIEAEMIHFHCMQGGYFDWRILPQISQEKKVIVTLHDDWIVSGNDPHNLFHPYKTQAQYLKRKEIFQHCNIEYVGVSNWITHKVQQDPILGKNPVHTLYNGIDTRIFSPHDKKDCRVELGLPLDKKVIVSIAGSGGKTNAKGLHYVNQVIKKYEHHHEYVFVTLGNFQQQKIRDNLIEIGYVSPELVAQYFSAADLFLYPTIMDSFGLVIAESLACGCPVVTFDTGGTGEIVHHGINGYVARHKDIQDLINGFDHWIAHSDTATAIDTQFTKECMIQQYEDLYKRLCS